MLEGGHQDCCCVRLSDSRASCVQSCIYRTAYLSNENLLVCAPTGAGKTNIAMIAVLHEVKAHLHYGVLQKKDFKIVYVAPMKALAAEMTRAFSHRLEPLGMVVKELTGDMQLTKRELDETQVSRTGTGTKQGSASRPAGTDGNRTCVVPVIWSPA